MKKILQEKWLSQLLRKSVLATTVAAYALSGNPMAQATDGNWEEPPVDGSAVPEVGVWLIGAGILAMLACEFLRRRAAHKRLQASI